MKNFNLPSRIARTSLLLQSAVAAALLVAFASSSMAQANWFWRNDGSLGNNWAETGRWWNGAPATLPANSSSNINLNFDGSLQLTSTNNIDNAGVRGVIFTSGGSSRTLDGNILRVSEGGLGKIENISGNTQTINLTLSNNTANGMEINPVTGRLNLSNVHLGTNFVNLFGGNIVDFRGAVSGSATFTMRTNSGIVTNLFSASNSMTGTINIDRGILVLNSTNATAGTGTINIGTTDAGFTPELRFGPAAALSNNVVNNINIVKSSSDGLSRTIRSFNASGTNVVTGTMANTNAGFVARIFQQNGGTLRFSNTVSGAGGFFMDGGTDSGGTVEFSSSNSFSGGFFIDNGTLKLGTEAATAGTGTLGIGAGSGAATNSNAAVRLSTSGGGVTLNNSSIQVRAGTGQRTIVSENTSGTNTITGNITLNNTLAVDATAGGAMTFNGVNITFAPNTILSLTNTGAVTISNQLVTSGDALLIKRGSGTVTLANGSNFGDMRYDLYAGTLQVSQEGNLGNASTEKLNKVYLDGGTLKATETFTFQANNGITVGSAGGTFEVDASRTLQLQGYINDISNTGVSLFKRGAGTLFLDRNGYDLNGTTWKVAEGTLSTWNPGGNLTATTELGGESTTGTYNFTKTDGAVSFDKNFLINAGGGRIRVTDNTLTNTGVVSGSGAFGKVGAGTLVLAGSSANTLTGATTVSEGTLELAKSSAEAVVGNLTVASGAKLLISASNQVGSGSGQTVTLSGGTIERASGVSETMGNLSLSATSALDYGTGAGGNLQFGTYSPTSGILLTLNNFGIGNTLKFSSDLSAFISSSTGTSFANDYFSISGMSSGGFTASFSAGTFTITSVPEPSTILAAFGLTGLMLWPLRRRFVRRSR